MNRVLKALVPWGLVLGLVGQPTPLRGGEVPEWFACVSDGTATRPDAQGLVVVKGRRSYSEERAWADARRELTESVGQWLAPEVPTDWRVPEPLIDALIESRHLEPVVIDRESLGLDPSLPTPDVLYLAGYRARFDPAMRAELVSAYRREVGQHRLTVAGGALGFVLACLAILAGYIRADEATRGYYTNRLRLVSAAAAGVASYAFYRWLI